MSKKIAILGGTYHKDDSAMVLMVQGLAEDLAKAGHEIWACGGQGIPLAAARGAHKVKDGLMAKVFTDFGDAKQIPRGNANEGGYADNLGKILNNPEIHIFFSGRSGTIVQLMAIIKMYAKGLKDPESGKKIIIYTPEGKEMMWLLRAFLEAGHIHDLPKNFHLVKSCKEIMALI